MISAKRKTNDVDEVVRKNHGNMKLGDFWCVCLFYVALGERF